MNYFVPVSALYNVGHYILILYLNYSACPIDVTSYPARRTVGDLSMESYKKKYTLVMVLKADKSVE